MSATTATARTLIRQLSTARPDFKRPLGFVFDIDGVLIRGGEVLPQAKEALRLLYEGGKVFRLAAKLSSAQKQELSRSVPQETVLTFLSAF